MSQPGTFWAPQLGLFLPRGKAAPCPPTIRQRLRELREEFAARAKVTERQR